LNVEQFCQRKFNKINFHFFEEIESSFGIVENFFFDASNLDVGLLTVAGVSYEASNQPAHSQAISCSPTPR
jgi:hypothetical protein